MSSFRFKDTTPQLVKDIENEPEIIEVIERDGLHVARALWRDRTFEEALPKGIETWTKDEQKSTIKLTARRLKVLVGKAKWEEMASVAAAMMPKAAARELTEGDMARIAQAERKREKRAAKLVVP